MRRLQTLNIPCGQGGLNASRSPSRVRDIDLVALESLTFEHDTWEKDGGASKFSTVQISGGPSVLALHDFHTHAGAQELVCATGDGKLAVLGVGGVSKTVYTGGGTDKHTLLVEGYDGTQKVLYFYNGFVAPRVYAGGTDTTLLLSASVGAFTADNTTDTFTLAAHGLANGTPVQVRNSGGALPAGLSIDTEYYIINTAANTFQLSATVGGAAINITDNGSGTHTIYRATRPADWVAGKPTWAFMHIGRMYAGGNRNRPDGVYASVLSNHNDYLSTGSLFFSVYPGEGERIVGGISWRNKNYIFKYPKGIYVLDDSSADTADWGYRRVSKYVGCVGPTAMLEADDEVYFVSPDGFIHALSAVQESGDVMSSAILPMELGTYIRENVNFTRLARAASAYYAKKRKIIFGFSAAASSVNNLLVGLDIHRTVQGARDVQPFASTRDECQSLAIYRDASSEQNQLLAGTSTGYVYQLDTEARSKDGAGYMSRFETKDIDLFDEGARNANLRELEVTFVPTGNWNLTLKVYKDGDLGDPISMSMIGSGGILDAFVLDTDVLGTDVLQNGRGRLYGDCRRVRIAGENAEPDETFSITNLALRYTPGNVR